VKALIHALGALLIVDAGHSRAAYLDRPVRIVDASPKL
jgi:hypothetical protein